MHSPGKRKLETMLEFPDRKLVTQNLNVSFSIDRKREFMPII